MNFVQDVSASVPRNVGSDAKRDLPTTDTVIALPSRIAREALRSALVGRGVRVVGEAGTGTDALQLVVKTGARRLVLDASTPVEGFDQILMHAARLLPDVTIVILVNDALGARPATYEHVVVTTESGLRGLSDALGVRSVAAATGRLLSAREREILKLIAEGLSNPDIAQKLYISHRTVANHVAKVFRKLHVNDRTHAVLLAARNGLITLEA
jgi:DNA-binding NarL/FixJ family response regulator